MTETAFYKTIKNEVDKVTKDRCVSVTLTFESMAFLNNAEQVSAEWKQLEKHCRKYKKMPEGPSKDSLNNEIAKLRNIILDNKQTEFPLATLKGGLRYWWRALQWVPAKIQAIQDNPEKKIPEDEKELDQAALKILHKQERWLWGSAEEDNHIGWSKVRLKLTESSLKMRRTHEDIGTLCPVMPIQYLAGQGYKFSGVKRELLTAKQNDIACFRPIALPKLKISFDIHFSSSLSKQVIQEVLETLLCFAEFGGVGSRSRKGFGSFSVSFNQSLIRENGKKLTQHQLYSQLINKIKNELINNSNITNWAFPPIPAFSHKTQWAQYKVNNIKSNPLIGLIGAAYYNARLQIGQNDCDRVGKGKTPARLQVGFPLKTGVIKKKNRKTYSADFYLFYTNLIDQNEESVSTNNQPKKDQVNRRASMVFLSIGESDKQQKLINVLLLTSDFLPSSKSDKKAKLLYRRSSREKKYQILHFSPQNIVEDLCNVPGFFGTLNQNLKKSEDISENFTVNHQGKTANDVK